MSQSSATGSAAGDTLRRGRRRPGEAGIKVLLVAAAVISIVTTVGIIIALLGPTVGFFREIPFSDFLFGTSWTPTFEQKSYGVLPLVVATLVVSLISLVIALPLGLGSAVYLAEYASDKSRRVIKPLLEILAGVPTVVYGFFALTAINPLIQKFWPGSEQPEFQNLLIASLAMGIMIVPTIASVAEDAMSAVPRSLREGAYALASSKMQVAVKVVIPAALSGIIAAVVLGISRAVGETMIVTIAAGSNSSAVNWNPIEGASTMTAYIASVASGDIPVGTIDYDTVFVVGSLLFVMTFALNALSIRLVRRFREVYE